MRFLPLLLLPLAVVAQDASDWRCNTTTCYARDPHAQRIVDMRLPDTRPWPVGEWTTVDLRLPEDAVGVTLRVRGAISRATKGEQFGVQFRAPGTLTENEPNADNAYNCKFRAVTGSTGVREDCTVSVAVEAGVVEMRVWMRHSETYGAMSVWVDSFGRDR